MVDDAPPIAPPTASVRRYLRDGLPEVYRDGRPEGHADRPGPPTYHPPQEEPFAMRFLQGLEEVLDPIVAYLDALPAHLDLALAPPYFVMLLGEWLGVDPDGEWRGLLGDDEVRRRELVSHATVIARRRGTAGSLQLVLNLLFPDLDLRVHDFGRSTFSAERRDPPAAKAAFEVVSAVEPARGREEAIRRVVDQLRPVHVKYEGLRVEEAPA